MAFDLSKCTKSLIVGFALIWLSGCFDSETASKTDQSTNPDQSSVDQSGGGITGVDASPAPDTSNDQVSSGLNPDTSTSTSTSTSQDDNSPPDEIAEPTQTLVAPSFKLKPMTESRSLQGDMSANNWAYDIQKGSGTDNLVFKVLSNSNASLFEKQPDISYPSGTLRYITKPSSGGQAKLTVSLHNKDTDKSSEVLETMIKINAAPTNNAPSFSAMGDSRSLNNTGSVQIQDWATSISDNNSEADQSMYFEITANSNPSLFHDSPTVSYPSGTLRYKAKPDAEGTARITVALVDDAKGTYGGESTSALYSFNITIEKPVSKAVNHAPSYAHQGDQTSLDDAGTVEVPGWAYDISDGDGNTQKLSFEIVSNANTNLFTVQPSVSYPSGTLRYKVKPNAEGSAEITLVLADDGQGSIGGENKSLPLRFTITIEKSVPNLVNHAPSFSNKGDQTSKDDAGAEEIPGWAYDISDGDGDTQNLSFEIVSNSTPSLFAVQPSVSYPSGTLRYTPKEGSEGTATISVRLKDDGGTSNGGVDASENVKFILSIEKMTINGLPADPGEEGKKTILGIDSNSNGIRDDIEIELYYLYEDQYRIRNILYEIAKGSQIAFELYLSGDFEKAKREKRRSTESIECLIGSDDPHKDLQTLQLLSANTPDRFSTYWDLNDSMAAYYNDEVIEPIDCGVYE